MRNSARRLLVIALLFAAPPGLAEEGKDGCVTGGCSGQSCTESTAEPVMTTCEFLLKYACTQKFAFTLQPKYEDCIKNPERYQE